MASGDHDGMHFTLKKQWFPSFADETTCASDRCYVQRNEGPSNVDATTRDRSRTTPGRATARCYKGCDIRQL
jgi:hypothetical protein